jgi:uncharacterized protein YceH (UPF0502 family)
MLRGPQTPGELRIRTERIHRFEELDDVLSALQRLMQREPSLATALPRQPGTKEIRYAHMLSCAIDVSAAIPQREESGGNASSTQTRLTALESEVATLRQEIQDLKEQLAALQQPSS